MVKIRVQVKPNSKTDLVEEAGDELVARVKAQAVDSKANEALIKLLSKHFKVPKTCIKIVRGATARRKLIEIKEK